MELKFERFLTLIVSIIICGTAVQAACNEAVCASLVSKCMLLKSCECDMSDKNNCTCCIECHKCLAKLYTECCSCVGMCPQAEIGNELQKTSTVEQLTEPIPGLFSLLTEEEDPHTRWTTYTYPAHLDLLYFKPPKTDGITTMDLTGNSDPSVDKTVQHGHHQVIYDSTAQFQNCTVAYMVDCMSLGKCRTACHSMGAARYRWFHEYGCCECIGSTCLDYGKGEAMCLRCPPSIEEDNQDYLYDFGDEDDMDKKDSKKEEMNASRAPDEEFDDPNAFAFGGT